MNKYEFVKNLTENINNEFKKVLISKGLSEDSCDSVIGIVIDSATHGYDAGFDSARIAYAAKCVTQIGEIFKK
jgi:hypothetical protein